jgi:hypothetical protein
LTRGIDENQYQSELVGILAEDQPGSPECKLEALPHEPTCSVKEESRRERENSREKKHIGRNVIRKEKRMK